MKNIKSIFSALFLFGIMMASAQDVSFKKGIITIDGTECLKYDSDSNNVIYKNLKDEEIFILKFIRVNGQLYTKVVFLESNQSLTSQSYIFTKKILVEKLLKSNALENCELNEEKVANFIVKFDERVEERMNSNNGTNTVIIREEPRRASGVNINIGR